MFIPLNDYKGIIKSWWQINILVLLAILNLGCKSCDFINKYHFQNNCKLKRNFFYQIVSTRRAKLALLRLTARRGQKHVSKKADSWSNTNVKRLAEVVKKKAGKSRNMKTWDRPKIVFWAAADSVGAQIQQEFSAPFI